MYFNNSENDTPITAFIVFYQVHRGEGPLFHCLVSLQQSYWFAFTMCDTEQTNKSERRQGLGVWFQWNLTRPRIHRYTTLSCRKLVCIAQVFPATSADAPVFVFSGPKLFKEPSFKSNKFIIHNALSRCCLAGKVNETQKHKMVEVKLSFIIDCQLP